MTPGEFVFRLPGKALKKLAIPRDAEQRLDQEIAMALDLKWLTIEPEFYPIDALRDYDRIFGEEIRDWEARLRHGIVEIIQCVDDEHMQVLGEMPVDEAKEKFL